MPSFADILSSVEEQQQRKVAVKLSDWIGKGIEIPSSLALEQCSSLVTARYKAKAALDFIRSSSFRAEEEKCVSPHCGTEKAESTYLKSGEKDAGSKCTQGFKIVDISGGLGVDSFALSQIASSVDYYERDAQLAAAVERNAEKIGINNIVFHPQEVNLSTELGQADLIYADPARRSADGRKVFRLEDCSPNILTLLPMLFSRAGHIMLKLSPMADISVLAKSFGPELRELHIISYDKEVKELLCFLKRNSQGALKIRVVQVSQSGSQELLCFTPEEEKVSEPVFAGTITQNDILFVPIAALRKASAFKTVCSQFGLAKLSPSTHLYIGPDNSLNGSAALLDKSQAFSESQEQFFDSKLSDTIKSGLFTCFSIKQVLPFSKASLKELSKSCPRADVSSHNMPLSSEELRNKLAIKSGAPLHIFACDTLSMGRILIVGESLF